MTPSDTRQSAGHVSVRISAAIQNEYDTRAVFGGGDEEWPEVPRTPGCHALPRATAQAMLDDALFNGDSRHGPEEMPGGTRRAYRALAEQLQTLLGTDQPAAAAPASPKPDTNNG
ncbi:hypothetical protein R70006_06220 [Paraburkholderia domus]|uniref:hypothetical protein n=1 Tax=Paraburkholderia domus TaxID=2793075 RepID=UPI0019143004|nr:hypothetical protein [Paraburkholderia domus]MBK5052851.1 hypothetical protein [Burkholderia sp. R-70006]CAE6821480.1 hypothetical protein R70006_06220 [Paraburkholderia domus]